MTGNESSNCVNSLLESLSSTWGNKSSNSIALGYLITRAGLGPGAFKDRLCFIISSYDKRLK